MLSFLTPLHQARLIRSGKRLPKLFSTTLDRLDVVFFRIYHHDSYLSNLVILADGIPEVFRTRTSIVFLVVIKPVLNRPQAAGIDVTDQLALGQIVHRFSSGIDRFVQARLERQIFLAPPIDGVARESDFLTRERDIRHRLDMFKKGLLPLIPLHRLSRSSPWHL